MNATTSPLFIKSAKLAATCLSLVVFQLTSAHAQWDFEYTGSDMVASPWSTTPFPNNPTVVDSDMLIAPASDQLATLDNTSFWSGGDTFTIEFDMAITDSGTENAQALWAFGGADGDWQILLNQGGVTLNGTGFVYGTSLGASANTYRLVVDSGSGSLYVNNNEVISGIVAGAVVPSYQLLWVGDYGGGVNGGGTWSSLNINNTTAIPIPEPSAAVLLFGVLAGGLVLRRRRA